MIDIYNVSLLDLLPDSLKQDPDMQALAAAITPELQAISAAIVECMLWSRIDALTEEILDLLAMQLHVDFYDASLMIEQKRELVKKSLSWHRRKGTPSAVEGLIATVFGDGKVEEWWEYGGQPYMFRVVTNNESVTNEQANEFLWALNSVKNERSWLEQIVILMNDTMGLYLAGVYHEGEFSTLRQVV